MSYPDITLIRDICAILQVSEHELLTASEDVEARTAETLAKKYLSLLPKEVVMIVLPTEELDGLLEFVKKELYTGHIGDGKIFVSDVTNVVRVRTGEEGIDALMYGEK